MGLIVASCAVQLQQGQVSSSRRGAHDAPIRMAEESRDMDQGFTGLGFRVARYVSLIPFKV